VGEILGLKWSDIKSDGKNICISRTVKYGKFSLPKTEESKRTISILPVVRAALKEQLKISGNNEMWLIFPNAVGKPHFDSKNISARKWKPLLRKLGLPVGPIYWTRHSFMSIMAAHNVDIPCVSKMMAHTNIATTCKIYYRYQDRDNIDRASFLKDYFRDESKEGDESEQTPPPTN
jgi:integrase